MISSAQDPGARRKRNCETDGESVAARSIRPAALLHPSEWFG